MTRLDSGLAQAWLSYGALRLGRAGVAGLVLLAASVAVLLASRVASDEAALQARIAQARAELQRAPAGGQAERTPQAFLAQLPAAEQVPRFIEGVHRSATRAGLQIERAEYRAPALAGGQVLRSQMVLPVMGGYPGLAGWLGDVLAENPSAALDELSLQRDPAGGEPLRARVVLSHYARSAP